MLLQWHLVRVHMQFINPASGTRMKILTGCLWKDTLIRKQDEVRLRIILSVQGSGTDSEGGYLVPDEYEKKLVEALEEEAFFRNLATVIKTSSGDRKIPIVTSKGEAAWIDEGGQFPESDDSFGQTTISAFKLATMIKVSDELLNLS